MPMLREDGQGLLHYAFHNEAIVCTAETLQFLIQTVGAEVVWAFAVGSVVH